MCTASAHLKVALYNGNTVMALRGSHSGALASRPGANHEYIELLNC